MGTEHIVILGEGATAWMLAASLSDALQHTGTLITVIELEQDPINPEPENFAVDSLGPITQIFHETLGWDEAALLKKTAGTFTLGFRFDGWREPGNHFVQSFSDSGVRFYGREFQHYYVRLKQRLNLPDYHHFSLSAMAAERGHFCHPVADQRSVLSTLSYGLNLDSHAYAQQLKEYAQAKGVCIKRGNFVTAKLKDDGSVRKVLLTNGAVTGDYFLDCSGSQSLLLAQALGAKNIKWDEPYNRKATVQRRHKGELPVLSHFVKADRYWRKSISLAHCSLETLVFERDELTDDEVRKLVQQDGVCVAELEAGHKPEPWHKNVIAFGDAAVTFEPFGFSRMDMLYANVQAFLRLLPVASRSELNAREYNRIATAAYTQLRDYQLCHHYLGQLRQVSAQLANDRDKASIPLSLARRVELFAQCGKLAFVDGNVIPSALWVSLFMGMGLWPRSYDPLVDLTDETEITTSLARMRAIITQTAASMPAATRYLQRYLEVSGS